MAKLNGLISKLSGKVGNVQFARVKGQTIVKELPEKKKNRVFTEAQASQNMRWANVVALWKSFVGNLKPSFENVAQTSSLFNEFMAANLSHTPIFLTKDEQRNGGCVLSDYFVSKGSLASMAIEETDDTHIPYCEIDLGELNITAATTVADFTETVLTNNPSFREGDKITCFYCMNEVVNGVPRLAMIAGTVTLRSDDDTKLMTIVTTNGFFNQGGNLGCRTKPTGGVVWIHSRLDPNGKTLVSTQQFYCTNAEMQNEYKGKVKMLQAAESYGTLKRNMFLTPDVNVAQRA